MCDGFECSPRPCLRHKCYAAKRIFEECVFLKKTPGKARTEWISGFFTDKAIFVKRERARG